MWQFPNNHLPDLQSGDNPLSADPHYVDSQFGKRQV